MMENSFIILPVYIWLPGIIASKKMHVPIGIDLGTTFSVIACYRNDRVEIISDSNTQRLIPSMVYYDPETGDALVGLFAYTESEHFLPNLVKDSKRIIGRKFKDEMVQKYIHSSRCISLAETDSEMAAFKVTIKGQTVLKTPEEISAEVLKYLKDYASEYLGEEIKEAVISVPAYFSGAQRKCTIKAAELAGLKVTKLISEPVAGALHYVTDKNITAKLLVFDFGGGTLDISLIEAQNKEFKVVLVKGDTMLGGRNIDDNLFKHFYVPQRKSINKFVWRNLRRLEECCITLKELLSKRVIFRKIIDCYDGEDDLYLNLDRKTFEKLNQSIFDRIIDILRDCLQSANWTKDNIDMVVLVGGSTKIPRIREILKQFFGDSKIKTDLNPDEAVASGACLQAAIINKIPFPLENFVINEITPLSLGIAMYGNLMKVLIPKYTRLPFQRKGSFRTVENNQRCMDVDIYEGERKNCRYNNKLASFTIENLPQKRAGDVIVSVTFDMNVDGILSATAVEESTGKSKSLSVTLGQFGLNEREVSFNPEEAKNLKESDDRFVKFVVERYQMQIKCERFIYDNKNQSLKQVCEDFILYSSNLDDTMIDELCSKFDKLPNEIKNM